MSSLYFFLTSPSLSMVIKVMLIPYLYQYSSLCIIYIFRILVFRKSSLKDVVFRGCGLCNLRSENPSGISEMSKTRSFKVSYYVVGLLAISYDIIRDIVNNLTFIRIIILYFLSLLHTLQNEYCDAKFIYGVLSKYLDELQKWKRKVHISIFYIDVYFCFIWLRDIWMFT